MLHVGAAYRYANLNTGLPQGAQSGFPFQPAFNVQPDIRLTYPNLLAVTPGNIASQNQFGSELAGNWGSFNFMTEAYYVNNVRTPVGGSTVATPDLNYWGTRQSATF